MMDALLGTRRYNTARITDAFPDILTDNMDIEPVSSTSPFGVPFQTEHTYYIKVIRRRNRQLHGLSTHLRNTIYRTSRTGAPFTSFDSPHAMAKHEYTAAQTLYEAGGSIPYPYTYSKLPHGHAAIVYEYVPNTGSITDQERSLKGFNHIVQSLRRLHENDFIHGYISGHTMRTTPTGEPFIIEPIGASNDTHADTLLGIGHDLSTLLITYAPKIGTIPALRILEDHYTELELVAAYTTTTPLQTIMLGVSPWVVTHVRSSIESVVTEDAIDTYLNIMSNSDTAQYFDTEYDTASSTHDLLSDALLDSDNDTTMANIVTGSDETSSSTDRSTQDTGTSLDDTQLGRFSDHSNDDTR